MRILREWIGNLFESLHRWTSSETPKTKKKRLKRFFPDNVQQFPDPIQKKKATHRFIPRTKEENYFNRNEKREKEENL